MDTWFTTAPLIARKVLIKSLPAFILAFLCNARNGNSELFKESHDVAVYKNSYKNKLCKLISTSLDSVIYACI